MDWKIKSSLPLWILILRYSCTAKVFSAKVFSAKYALNFNKIETDIRLFICVLIVLNIPFGIFSLLFL